MIAQAKAARLSQRGEVADSRPVALGKGNLLLASSGLLALAAAYWLTLLPEALALLLLAH